MHIKTNSFGIIGSYTGKSNRQVWENLEWLSASGSPAHVTLRVPLIPDFNTPDDVERSVENLKRVGFTHFDRFTYKVTDKSKGEAPAATV